MTGTIVVVGVSFGSHLEFCERDEHRARQCVRIVPDTIVAGRKSCDLRAEWPCVERDCV